MDRRTFLLLTGSTASGLAGCLGDDADTETQTATPTATPEETSTPEETPTPVEGDSPESVAEAADRLVDAMASGAFPEAVDLFRGDARREISAGELEHLWLGYAAVGGTFEGTAGTEDVVQAGYDGVDVSLAFERGTHLLRVLVDDQDQFSVVGAHPSDEYRSPEYVDAGAFTTEETAVETDGCIMDATVTVPESGGEGDLPGVVLVHGSDPLGGADKDLTTGGSKPFRDLADGLASRGVAVLRYDRRSHACPGSLSPGEWTLDAVTVDDPLAALDRLREVPAVDSDRLAVAGLSLGGMVAPRIARCDGNLAGIAALAAPARDFYEIFLEQYEHLATLGRHDWEAMAEHYDRWEDRIDRIRDGDYDDGDHVLGYPGALWRSADEYDQVGTAREVETPMFLLQGERDYQVSAERDFGRWQDELADRPDTRFQLYEGLNHVFQHAQGPPTQSEYLLSNPVDEAVVEDLASWVRSL